MSHLRLLHGGRVLAPDGSIGAADVLLDGERIAEVRPGVQAEAAERVDVAGLTLVPGFIDLHVHGGGGFSLATTDPDELREYSAWAARQGVTGFLATVCAGSVDEAAACLQTIADAKAGGAQLLGVNLEGPFVSPARRGALPPGWVQPPDTATLARLIGAAAGRLRIMTLAPEPPGAAGVLEELLRAGIVASVGHTDATFEEAREAFAAGAAHVTHAFNAMRGLHHREPGPIGAALASDGVTVEVIADGVHLHPAVVRMLVRSLGPERVALITDGVTPAGLAQGVFAIGGQQATLKNGEMRLPDGTIAGSAATMAQVLRNVVSWDVADLSAASRMASATPARLLGLEGRKGAIAAGYEADIVALDDTLRVCRVFALGADAL